MTDADWQERQAWQAKHKAQALDFLATVDLGHFNNPEPAVNLMNEFMAFC